MAIDWDIVATIAAPLITLFFGVALSRKLERRPRLITYLGHVSAHRIDPETGNPIDVFTHSIVLQNAGRNAAHNVRITHSILPNFAVFPEIKYEVDHLPGGGSDIVVPVLVPQQEITISYLYFPPTTWDKINRIVTSNEGFAKVMNVLPAIQHPKWVNATAGSLMLIGIIALLYAIFEACKILFYL